MVILEITVQWKRGDKWKRGDSWTVIVEQTMPGSFLPVRSEGLLQLKLTELLAQVSPRSYGTVLGEALFCGDVRDAFVRARDASEDRLYVLLCVEDRELRTLRWERLCAPLDRGWNFLALDQRVPFSLYLPSLSDRRFPPIGRRDLRGLILTASPMHAHHGRALHAAAHYLPRSLHPAGW
jgi:hypothetical protein